MIGEQLHGEGDLRACVGLGVEPVQGGIAEAFRELDAAEDAGEIRLRFMRGLGGNQGLFKLGHGHAFGGVGGERLAVINPKRIQRRTKSRPPGLQSNFTPILHCSGPWQA